MSDFLQVLQWILITSFVCILGLFLSIISITMSKKFLDIDWIEEVRQKNNAAALVLLGILLMVGFILGFSLLGIQKS